LEFSATTIRRTTTDDVFDQLYDELVSLQLLPGTKLSEAEVAKRFGVSRQPVREAFSRLEGLDLLLIRPQRATEVRGFSMDRINHARFVRLAIECEVLNRACAVWDSEKADALQSRLDEQKEAIDSGKVDVFHTLDSEFHESICDLSGHPQAAENIAECKRELDRLCFLSLGREDEVVTLYEDHLAIAAALKEKQLDKVIKATRLHLSRLDSEINKILKLNVEYFE